MPFGRVTVLLVGLVSAASAAIGEEFGIKEVASVTALRPAELEPRTIAFSDTQGNESADPSTGLIRFEDWARARPAQKRFLSLYPSYSEPTIEVAVHGVVTAYKERLHVYVAAARFLLAKPAAAVDLARYATVAFLERIDPTIRHEAIAAADVKPLTDPESAHNQHPERRWCAGAPAICIQSRYQLEGRLPLGIRVANKLEEGGKRIADYMEFQSELRLLSSPEFDQPGLAELTGLDAPIAGVLEQSVFYVNQMMQFGKFLAVLQQHPSDSSETIATVFVALAVETDVLELKKEYEHVPVLRNLVPSQVLLGKSSFNTGTSLSAGLPDYTRNRIKAIASILDRE